MNEKVKELEKLMNDYIVNNNFEYSNLYDNLKIFLDVCLILEDGLCNYADELNENVYSSRLAKMSLFEQLKIVDMFYKDYGIEFDLERAINDGTIDFIYYDQNKVREQLENTKQVYIMGGSNYYENFKKLVSIVNSGLVIDTIIMIHELSHLRDQPDIGRGEVTFC